MKRISLLVCMLMCIACFLPSCKTDDTIMYDFPSLRINRYCEIDEISDDDLDSVAGGACQNVEDDPLIGKIVRVTSGQTCKKCGGNIGIVDTSRLGYGLVLAANCKDCTAGNKVYEIAILDQCTYEIIG